MSFVQPTTNPAGRTAGIGIAVAFHIALIYALASGLGHKLVVAIAEPLEAKLIEEVKPPPPPPKVIELPPPPKVTPPPPAFVPPPEVRVQTPPTAQPTISAQVSDTPPTAVTQAAPQAPAPAAAPVAASVVCSNYAQVMGDAGFPREATRLGLDEGRALIQFTLGPGGEIKDIKVVSATHVAFAKGAMRVVGEYKCAGQGRDVPVQVSVAFKSS
jgi:protein TonB